MDRVVRHSTTIKVRDDATKLYHNALVTVEVNLDAILRALGGRAARSKGKKAVEIGGLVVVRAKRT